MAQILLPQRFLAQPQYPAPIDYSGLGKGIQLLFNPAIGPVDLATGRIWTPGGNASVATGRRGKVFSFDGIDDYYAYTGYPEITGNIGTFFIWCPVVGGADTNGHVFFGHSSPSVRGHQVYPSGAMAFASVNSNSGVLPSWFNTTDRSLVFSSAGTAATTKAFLDGAGTSVIWTLTPGSWGVGNKNFNFGRYVGGSSWDFNGSILIAGYTTEVWSESEARAFHQNPFALFKAPYGKLWVVPAGAASSSAGASTGSSSVSGVGASIVSASGSSSGASTVSGVGDSGSVVSSDGSASGVSTVSGVGSSVADAAVSVSGSSTASGVGDFTLPGSAVGTAYGTSSASGATASTAASSGTGNGVASVSGFGASTLSTQGVASGSATVSGVGDSIVPTVVSAVGTASGSSTVRGVSDEGDSLGGDDAILIYEEPKKKKRKPKKSIEDILGEAIKAIAKDAETIPAAVDRLKESPKKEIVHAPVAKADPVEQFRAAEEEAQKVSALLVQYQEEVKRREFEEDEDLLMLIMEAF